MKDIYTLGIDIGSTTSKCVVLINGKTIASSNIVELGAGTNGVDLVIANTLGEIDMKLEDMDAIISTGYGRNSYDKADKTMSELSCHARGAGFLFDNVRTIIDIGGQDAKVLKLDANGQLQNFVMNDKCAAGTGRFLEVMANVLNVKLEDFGALDALSTNRASISSTCTVFAESEVISNLANNVDVKDILKGIHYSVASRVAGQAKRVGVEPPVAMTGGVSRNAGVVRALEAELNVPIEISDKSQLAGAIGASIFAYEYYSKQKKGE
ncbi:MAG: acyl-CoA dehydratase activase [Anaerovoracaceae bacterium]